MATVLSPRAVQGLRSMTRIAVDQHLKASLSLRCRGRFAPAAALGTDPSLVRRQSLSLTTASPVRVLSASAATFSPPAPSAGSSAADVRPAQSADSWQIKILYDGDCPICMKEVDFLQRCNEKYQTLNFVDISDPDYSPEDNAGISFEEAMGHIHGITRDGEVVTGIEAFKKFYEAVGLGWVYAATKFKPVQLLADAAYSVFAKYRLQLSGRPGLEAVLAERRRAKEGDKGCTNVEEECVVEW